VGKQTGRILLGQVVTALSVIVRSEGDLIVFDSPEDAARNAEWPDVEDGLYSGWDDSGRQLEFAVVERLARRKVLPGERKIKEVVVRPVEGKFAPDELRQELSRFLMREISGNDLDRMTLQQLVSEARQRFGVQRSS
jgi:hypothetical protein